MACMHSMWSYTHEYVWIVPSSLAVSELCRRECSPKKLRINPERWNITVVLCKPAINVLTIYRGIGCCQQNHRYLLFTFENKFYFLSRNRLLPTKPPVFTNYIPEQVLLFVEEPVVANKTTGIYYLHSGTSSTFCRGTGCCQQNHRYLLFTFGNKFYFLSRNRLLPTKPPVFTIYIPEQVLLFVECIPTVPTRWSSVTSGQRTVTCGHTVAGRFYTNVRW